MDIRRCTMWPRRAKSKVSRAKREQMYDSGEATIIDAPYPGSDFYLPSWYSPCTIEHLFLDFVCIFFFLHIYCTRELVIA